MMQAAAPSHTIIHIPHWLLMLILALILHAGLFLFYQPSQPDNGALDIGEQGVEVGLKVFLPPPKLVAPPPEAKIAPKPVPLKPEPKSKPIQKLVEKPKPIVKSKPIIKPVPAPIVIPEPEVLIEPEVIAIEPAPEPESVEEVVLEETVTEETVIEETVIIEEPVTKEVEKAVAETITEPVPAALEVGPKPVTEGVPDSMNETDQPAIIATGGGNPEIEANYIAVLLNKLKKYKRYPSVAKRRGQEGVVELAFSVDEQGQLLSYEIVSASDYKSLNKAVEKMIKRAAPFPPPPEDLLKGSSQFSYRVPVEFELL